MISRQPAPANLYFDIPTTYTGCCTLLCFSVNKQLASHLITLLNGSPHRTLLVPSLNRGCSQHRSYSPDTTGHPTVKVELGFLVGDETDDQNLGNAMAKALLVYGI
jgi:hypothetical protein